MSKRERRADAPFMGCDGEGWGTNQHGQQDYRMLRIGDRELFTGKPLSTAQCLDFICHTPPRPLLVGYGFGYDVTQILRDLPLERLRRLFTDAGDDWSARTTNFGLFNLQYIPRNFLRVSRVEKRTLKLSFRPEPVTTVTTIKGSSRTIWEVSGFFQKGFGAILKDFGIGRQHWQRIDEFKALRGSFADVNPAEIGIYNALECELLAELMERFRDICRSSGLDPATWSGSGKLAHYLHKRHGTPSKIDVQAWVPAPVRQLAKDAYYGGRFELTGAGRFGQCWAYDIRSAYPAAMLALPCLLHGNWQEADPRALQRDRRNLHVASVEFWHPKGTPLCGLPIRDKDGKLSWPRRGRGIYWSDEIHAARKLGARVHVYSGWRYVPGCTCDPMAWVAELFELRRQLDALGARERNGKQGYALKLAINSLYGKMAQRIGAKPWENYVWAGLITARTRAALIRAAAHAPHDVLMFATDGVFSLSPLPLEIGEGLGQWEAKRLGGIFLVQPGLYWPEGGRAKSRGLSNAGGEFDRYKPDFERAWSRWALGTRFHGAPPPTVPIRHRVFTGLRLAYARGKPETAGSWTDAPMTIDFDWSGKRDPDGALWAGALGVRTQPLPGSRWLTTQPHDSKDPFTNLHALSQQDFDRMFWDDQPDGPVAIIGE